MTYCLALQVDSGIVFAADSRTNAGVDYITKYNKLHVFEPGDDRTFVILSAGNLATTQEVMDLVRRDLDSGTVAESLGTVRYMFEAARYLGRTNVQVQLEHHDALARSGVSGESTLILGGQVAGEDPKIFLVYPQGNFIHATSRTPYLQIGETKYGKPMLDRLASMSLSLEDAARMALVSLDATMRSNITVGPPLHLALYRRDAFALELSVELKPEDEYFRRYRERWQKGMEQAFRKLPRFEWERGDPNGAA